MAKKAYVGINTTVPIYEEKNTLLNTATLLQEKFSFSGLGNYTNEFSLSPTTGIFQSNNAGAYYEDEYEDEETGETVYEEEGEDSWMQWTALSDITDLYFDWKVSSEENYDILTIYDNNKTYVSASGEQSGTIGPLNLKVGDYLEFLYYKDSSADHGEDTATISNVRCYSQTQVGTTIKPVAHNVNSIYLGVNDIAHTVIKAYIGVGGVARPFWDNCLGNVITYYGQLNTPSPQYSHSAGASTKTYAIFAGDTNSASANDYILTFNANLTSTRIDNGYPAGHVNECAGCSFANKACFCGGWYMYGNGANDPRNINSIIAYNDDLTTSTYSYANTHYNPNVTATRNHLILMSGGHEPYTMYHNPYTELLSTKCTAFSTDFTRLTLDNTTMPRAYCGVATINKELAIFAGGGVPTSVSSYSATSQTDIYDKTLTHTILSSGIKARYHIGAGGTSQYAFFAGGLRYYNDDDYTIFQDTVEVLDKTLTKTTLAPLDIKRAFDFNGAIALGSAFLVPASSWTDANSNKSTRPESYDKNFTHTTLTNTYFSGQGKPPVAAVDHYAIQSGGYPSAFIIT